MRRSQVLILALLCSLSFALRAGAQQSREQTPAQKPDDQAIKVTTSLVEVRAVVTDKQGSPVRNLKREDFEVLENKDLQEISFFSQITVGGGERPETATTPNPASPTEARRPDGADRPTRTIVLFVDNLHLSDGNLLLSKQTLKKFIAERLNDDDLVAVMTSGGALGLFSQFTRDRRVLQYAVDKISPRGSNRQTHFSPYLAALVQNGNREAMDLAIQVLQAEDSMTGPRSVMEGIAQSRSSQILQEASYRRRIALATLKALTERMAGLPGQRLIVALSDGFTLFGVGGSMETEELRAVTSKAAVSGVVIYTIDAKGLQPPPGFDASMRAMPGSPSANAFLSRADDDLENSMNALAKDTGGEPFFNTNDLNGAIRKAVDNNSYFYALSYYPSGDEESSRFRRITVRVKGHPEYRVRAQQGYLPSALGKERKSAEAKSPQQRLAEAAVSPLAISDIGVFATADYIETEVDSAQVSLQVFIDGSKLRYTEEKERHRLVLEMISLVFDSSGKQVKADSTTIQTNLLPVSLERAKQLGLRYTRRVELKPGTYQIRIGIREVETEKIGTAAAWVEVPDIAGKKLHVSNILLTDPTTLDYVTTLGKENLTLQNGTRQGLRAYHQRDMLGFYVRVYPPAKSSSAELAGLTYQSEIWLGDHLVAETGWKPLPLAQDTTKGVELGRQIPLAGIPPGFYDLKVVVRSPKTKNPTVRAVAFEITR